MKKHLRSVVSLLFAGLAYIPTHSQLLEENFSYLAGDTLVTRGWSQTGTSTTNPILTRDGGLRYTNYASSGIGNSVLLQSNGQDVNRGFPLQTAGAVYASFLASFSAAQAGDYFFHFIQSPNTSNLFFGRVFVRSAVNGNLTFGVSKTSTSATIPPTYSDSIYQLNATYLIIVKYKFNTDTANNDQVSLFVFSEPTLPLPEPPVPTVGPITSSQLDATDVGFLGLRQGTASTAPTLIIDGIRVSTTWSLTSNRIVWVAGLGNWGGPANWNLNRSPLETDSVVIPTGGPTLSSATATIGALHVLSGGLSLINTNLSISRSMEIDSLGTVSGSPTALSTGGDATIRGTLRIDSNAAPIITCGRNWIRGIGSIFLPGLATVRFTGAGRFERNFYNVLVDSGSVMKSSGNIIVGNRFEARGLDTLRNSDTLIIMRADSTGLIGVGKIVGGTIRRAMQPATLARYRFESNSSFVEFRPQGITPPLLTMTVYPDTNPLSFGSQWVRIGGSVDTVKHAIRVDSIRRFSRWGVGIPFPERVGATKLLTFVRRVYSIQFLGDTNFVASLSLRYEPSEIPLGVSEPSLGLYRMDFPNAVPNVELEISNDFMLYQNYPNPFNPTTEIRFQMREVGHVTLEVFDVLGRKVATLMNEVKQPGTYTVPWDAANVASGVYFYQLAAGSFVQTRRMCAIK